MELYDLIIILMGNIVALFLSWNRNKNFLYALAAFILGWIYIAYWAVTEAQDCG